MKRFAGLLLTFCILGSSIAAAADLGCVDTDPLPVAPAAGDEATTFNGSFFTLSSIRIDLWRMNCSPAGYRVAIRVTPTLGTPNVCGTDFYVIQGGAQYNVLLLQSGTARSGFCSDLFVPTTFLLGQYASDPQIDRSQGFRLIYNGAPATTYGDLPAAGTAAPAAITPAIGLWWNPNESGSGYSLDVKHGVLVVTIFSYKPNGDAQWYYVSGPLTNGGRSFTASLDKYVGGQCISCPYAGRPTLSGSDGTITINFSSSTSATVTLPGGRVTNIEPQPF